MRVARWNLHVVPHTVICDMRARSTGCRPRFEPHHLRAQANQEDDTADVVDTLALIETIERVLQETLHSDLVWMSDQSFDCIALTTMKVSLSRCYQVVVCSQNHCMDDVGLPQEFPGKYSVVETVTTSTQSFHWPGQTPPPSC